MFNAGIYTTKQLAKVSLSGQSQVSRLVHLKIKPKTMSGKWRKDAIRISSALGMEPDELFPSHIKYELLTDEIDLYHGELRHETWHCVKRNELTAIVESVLETLVTREAFVLRERYFKLTTPEAISKILGVTTERVRQIERNAIKKMWHKSRAKPLYQAWKGKEYK